MIGRLLSLLFVATLFLSFVYIKIAAVTFLIFIILSIGLMFTNGNKLKLFSAAILLFVIVLSGFFFGINMSADNETLVNETKTNRENKNREVRDRLIELRLMIDNQNDSAKILAYVYDTIKIAEEAVNADNAESYLNLGYVYEIANALGIESAKEKALESFAKYCTLNRDDKTCQLVD
jgi:uncharacterized membrane protein YqjE